MYPTTNPGRQEIADNILENREGMFVDACEKQPVASAYMMGMAEELAKQVKKRPMILVQCGEACHFQYTEWLLAKMFREDNNDFWVATLGIRDAFIEAEVHAMGDMVFIEALDDFYASVDDVAKGYADKLIEEAEAATAQNRRQKRR